MQYLTAKENDKDIYLLNLKNGWSFWSLYNESLNYLLNNLPLEKKAKEALIKGGPLERYQFVYLLKEFPKIKKLFNDMSSEYEIAFTKFLYGFGIFNGTIEEAIDFQEKINNFKENNIEKKQKILIILLGIVNHWNILILHKNIENKINIYFLDSRNNPEIFEPFELFNENGQKEENKEKIEAIKDKFIKEEIDKKPKKVSNWYKLCLKEWYNSMNISMIIILKILKNDLNLLNYIIKNKIMLLINTFIDKTGIDLSELKKDINIVDYNKKIWMWIKEDFHPAYFKDYILNDLKKANIKYNEKDFINWIIIIELFLNKEKENKEIEEDYKNIIERYIKEINDLKEFINFP